MTTNRPTRLPRAISTAILVALVATFVASRPALADHPPPPCVMPMAAALADRPGTGRDPSTGGSPCVVDLHELVVETGFRHQTMTGPGEHIALTSGPLTFVRLGVAKRLELGIAPPALESRAAVGTPPIDTARGLSDVVVAAKYQVLDEQNVQASLGALYTPPTGTGEFTNGGPTYSISGNLGLNVTPKLAFTTSQSFATQIGLGGGFNHPYAVYAPSYTLAYGIDDKTMLLLQAALVSRQGPTLPSGDRAFVAVQRALSDRLALDVEYERNLKPILGAPQNAIGVGVVWIASPRRPRR